MTTTNLKSGGVLAMHDKDVYYSRWNLYKLDSIGKNKKEEKVNTKLLWKRIDLTDKIWYYNDSDKGLSLEDFLIKKNQFVLTPKYYINDFVCISLDGTQIWHQGISKKKSNIEGCLEMWIKTFKRI